VETPPLKIVDFSNKLTVSFWTRYKNASCAVGVLGFPVLE